MTASGSFAAEAESAKAIEPGFETAVPYNDTVKSPRVRSMMLRMV